MLVVLVVLVLMLVMLVVLVVLVLMLVMLVVLFLLLLFHLLLLPMPADPLLFRISNALGALHEVIHKDPSLDLCLNSVSYPCCSPLSNPL